MKGAEKDAAMARFAAGETRLLVATTVIEVGVDVPEATVMVIEHAERFGLAQLHQLRGRVGRGAERSTCLLLYKAPLGETAKARLAIMRETEDGFRIAEEDLKLRGEGDVLGTRQSRHAGLPHRPHRGARRAARARRATTRALILARDPDARLRPRRGAAASALSVRARRGDPAAAGGIRRRRGGGAGSDLRDSASVRQSRERGELLLLIDGARLHHAGRHQQRHRLLDRDVEIDDRRCAAHRRKSRWSGSACTA